MSSRSRDQSNEAIQSAEAIVGWVTAALTDIAGA